MSTLLRPASPLPRHAPAHALGSRPRRRRTPFLELDVTKAVGRYRRLAAALPGSAVHYAVKANPHPALLARTGRGPLRGSTSPARPRCVPRCDAGAAARGPRALQPGLASRPPRGGRRARRAAVRRRLPWRGPQARRGRPGQRRAVPAGHLRRGVRLAAVAQVRVLRRRGRRGAHPRRATSASSRPASASTSARSSATRRPGAADRTPPPGCSPTLPRRGVALRLLDLGGGFPADLEGRDDGPAGRRPSRRTARSSVATSTRPSTADRPATLVEPGRGIVGDAGTWSASVVAVVQRGGVRWVYLDAGVFTGLVETLDEAIRYRISTAGARPDRARACSPGRPATAPTCSTRTSRSTSR